MNAAEVLERAADVIVERGWWRGPWSPYKGLTECAWTAIVRAAPTDGAKWDAGGRLAVHLGGDGDLPVRFVSHWNDDPSRTADEVITALRECAASLRATS